MNIEILRSFNYSVSKTNLMMPKLSKYPPRPMVPKGSLKEIMTLAMLSLFQSGVNILFPNLEQKKVADDVVSVDLFRLFNLSYQSIYLYLLQLLNYWIENPSKYFTKWKR